MEHYIGYTAGAFDMFHVGHLNLLRQARSLCEFLVVGVNSDRLIMEYKGKSTIIKQNDRLDIVSSIRCVDKAVIADTLDKVEAQKKFKFDVLFIGDDWKGSQRWIETEKEMKSMGVEVVYLSRTEGISSTELREKLKLIDNV